MTVAATILSATAEGALADTLGQPRVRRLVDIAWSGGALPVIVLSPDPDGSVAKALAGAEASHGLPSSETGGPVGQMILAAELALAEVHDTTAVLVWPARMTWVGPESVTSLIEAHGTDPNRVLRPAWRDDPGWPVLVPTIHLAALAALDPGLMPADVIDALGASVPTRLIDLGDPGTVLDVDTPIADLPAYEGPPEPPAGHTHEWGTDIESEAGLASPDPLD
jgi:CTP:molybdopterin cytidylyltransferase MocA